LLPNRSPETQLHALRKELSIFSSSSRHCLSPSIHSRPAELFLDAKQLVVFGNSIGPRQGSGFYQAAVRRNGDVCNRRIFGFA